MGLLDKLLGRTKPAASETMGSSSTSHDEMQPQTPSSADEHTHGESEEAAEDDES